MESRPVFWDQEQDCTPQEQDQTFWDRDLDQDQDQGRMIRNWNVNIRTVGFEADTVRFLKKFIRNRSAEKSVSI